MKRRTFLKGMLALPVMASLPVSMLPPKESVNNIIHVKFDNEETRFKFHYQDGGYIVSKKTSSQIFKATYKNSPFIRLAGR